MADKNFDSVEELMNYVYQKIEEAMSEIIAEHVKEKLRESIEANVFEVYTPSTYERRSLNSETQGLMNCWNSTVNAQGDTITLIIQNTATKVWSNSNKSLAELIEYGEEGEESQPWLQPRPFVQPVIEELKNSGEIQLLLQSALDFLV